jgi:hypothetical protein
MSSGFQFPNPGHSLRQGAPALFLKTSPGDELPFSKSNHALLIETFAKPFFTLWCVQKELNLQPSDPKS